MILPRVLSSHEEATVRCAKARPGSNSSAGSKAPVRLKTSGPHVLASLFEFDPVFIDRCDAEATCRTHPIWDESVPRRVLTIYFRRKQQAVLSFRQHVEEMQESGRLQDDGGTQNSCRSMKRVHKPAMIRSAARRFGARRNPLISKVARHFDEAQPKQCDDSSLAKRLRPDCGLRGFEFLRYS